VALTLSTLRKPVNRQVVDPSTGLIREEWDLFFQQLMTQHNAAVDEFGTLPTYAPTDAQYIVSTASAGLYAERVATDTTTIDYDAGTAGQAKWNVLEVPGIAAAGMVARTAAATYTARTLTAPAAGIGITNGDGVAGNPTLVLANDLAALEGLGSTGFAVRTGPDTWAQRTLQAGTGISIANPAGIAGDPSIACTATQSLGRRNVADISGGDTIIASDNAKLVNIASGTGTLAFTAAATLAAGFYCVIKNSGTGNVTLNPDGAELIDGLANWILYPGGSILVECDGSAFYSVLLSPMVATYNASDTWTKPGVGTWAEVEGWGGGGSGARGTNAENGGGAGGGYNRRLVPLSALGATETVTIGAGGAARAANNDGATGGDSSFGSHLIAYGGGGGDNAGNGGGGGGGPSSAGTIPSGAGGGVPGSPTFARSDGLNGNSSLQGAGGDNTAGRDGYVHGGGGGSGAQVGGNSVCGGAGGGGNTTAAAGNGGTSLFGGNGGDAAVNGADAQAGTQPGGGGGGSEGVATGISGAGGDGRIIVGVY
jgi:hypothetical protein